MDEIVLKATYRLVQQTPEQKREHMCSGCAFRKRPCMDLLPAGSHCAEGTVYVQKELQWLN